MSSTSATCFSSSRSDHRACPFGGVEQASAISLASTPPVTGEDTGGNARSFRPTVAHTSPPVSTYRFEIRRTDSHETPPRSAITARGSTSPTDVSNASSTRARQRDGLDGLGEAAPGTSVCPDGVLVVDAGPRGGSLGCSGGRCVCSAGGEQ